MSAAAMIRNLADAGVSLSRNGDRLHVKAKRGTITAELRAKLAAHKSELLAELSRRPVVRFRLADNGPNPWVTAIGRPGESVDTLRASLRERFGARLLEAQP